MLDLLKRQLNCNANYEFQTKVQCLHNMYFPASVRQDLYNVQKRSLE